MQHIQTQQEWEEEKSIKILNLIRNELYLELRFMEQALHTLTFKRTDGLRSMATDGVYLHYATEPMIRLFKNNPKFLDRAYLHTVLHCIFKHLWMRGNRNKDLWNIACDIAVEYTIDTMDKSCTKRILSLLRVETYRILKEEKMTSAAQICRWLKEQKEEKIQSLAMEFYTDDHVFWKDENSQSPMMQQAKENWDKVARQTSMEKSRKGDDSKEGEELLNAQIQAGKSRRRYGDFLRKFSVFSEEMKCDLEEFDIGFYSYGLRVYENMPLIEPMETREVQKIREFVIVVDTSDSTSGELVEGFLQETFRILTEKEHFFHKSKIRIIQCDNQVRQDRIITAGEDITKWMEGFEIAGGGSTDFRPAFAYVEELREKGEIRNLGGLLYFTDGKGVYPKKPTEYKTAFLFLDDFDELAVPPWAMRLQLEQEEFVHEY